MIVDVECIWAFCPKRLRGGERQHIGRLLVQDVTVAGEFYCPKCREARWYTASPTGAVAVAHGVVVAQRAPSRVLSTA